MQAATLVLRDIHQPPAPPMWPPAPGWWLVLAVLLLAVGAWAWVAARRRRRQRLIAALFDEAVLRAENPAAEVAAMSELLRRAARRRDPAADKLVGEAWLRWLDDVPPPQRDGEAGGTADIRQAELHPFSQGPGRLLLEGGYRRDVGAEEVAALQPLARARFMQWMGGR